MREAGSHICPWNPPLTWLGYLKGISSERGSGDSHRSEEVTHFIAHLLPPLKALLNHNQITVDCRFLLDRKPCSSFVPTTQLSGDSC